MKEAVSKWIEHRRARRRGRSLIRLVLHAPDEHVRKRAAELLLNPPLLYSAGFVKESDLAERGVPAIPVHGDPHEVIKPLYGGIEL